MKPQHTTKLLIVDDEEGMRQTLRRIMHAKGYDIEVAASGEEAIAKAPQFQPDCVLLDIRMPGMNGVETFRKLKHICPDAFAVFMTAFAASELTDEARNEGGIEVFSKPLEIDNVCALIERTSNTQPVLIVDDDPGFCDSMERILIARGYDVHTAGNVEAALDAFERCPRGIVLLDMRLNGGTGLDVLQRIRETNPHVLTVLMTGYSEMIDQMDEGLAAGGCCCFTKPFDVDDLINAINRAGDQ